MVFVDVESRDILDRLERMKVDRIVGQTEGVSMADILQYRQQFYEANYDVRVVCEEQESAESVTSKVDDALRRHNDAPPRYVSTRGHTSSDATFNDVVLEGLAPDGGLYVPDSLPQLTVGQWQRLVNLSYSQRAARVLEMWIHAVHVPPQALASMIDDTYSAGAFSSPDVFPVVHLHDNVYTTELFHGPTASFKDAALQLMPRLFHHARARSVEEAKIGDDAK